MGQGYFRNQDDAISDPELIAARARIGRSIFFEVQLTLAEFADNLSSLSGGVVGSPDYINSIALEAPSSVSQGGCPTLDCEILAGEVGFTRDDEPFIVKARDLVGQVGHISLYHPLTREYNLLIEAKPAIRPVVELITKAGRRSLVSDTHKVITSTQDIGGTPLRRWRDRLVVMNGLNLDYDYVESVEPVGKEDIVMISLEAGYIYCCDGILAHNRKDEDIDLPIGLPEV